MIIWGFRGATALLLTLTYVCETCGVSAAHQLARRVTKFTLFFVPLFPVRVTYLDTCLACGRAMKVTKEQARTALATVGAAA